LAFSCTQVRKEKPAEKKTMGLCQSQDEKEMESKTRQIDKELMQVNQL
jgi:hypothetical protein